MKEEARLNSVFFYSTVQVLTNRIVLFIFHRQSAAATGNGDTKNSMQILSAVEKSQLILCIPVLGKTIAVVAMETAFTLWCQYFI